MVLSPQSFFSSCLPELFCILHGCSFDCTELDSIIQWGLTINDTAVLRHCLGMILSLIAVSPSRGESLLFAMLSNSTVAAIIAQDTIASACYIRCCWALYNSTSNASYLSVLCQMTQQPNEASALLAMELLSLLPFDTLSGYTVTGANGNGGPLCLPPSSVELIQSMAETLRTLCTQHASEKDNVGLVAVSRVLVNLAKCLILHFGSRAAIRGSAQMDATRAAFDVIYATLMPFMTSISMYLQTAVLKVMIWLVDVPRDEAAQQQYADLVRNTRAMVLPTTTSGEILQQLAGRAASTPALAYFPMEVSWGWLQQNPLRVSVNNLLATWKACFALHDLENCGNVVNVGHEGAMNRRLCCDCSTTRPLPRSSTAIWAR